MANVCVDSSIDTLKSLSASSLRAARRHLLEESNYIRTNQELSDTLFALATVITGTLEQQQSDQRMEALTQKIAEGGGESK